MLDLKELYHILSTYGPWGVILLVVIYILVRGQFAFRYPRSQRRSRHD